LRHWWASLERGRRLRMWGDRFIDGEATGIGQWEAATNGTHPAVGHMPTDIAISDWHYGKARGTPASGTAPPGIGLNPASVG
jgi:hypothetical protein